MLGVSDAHLDNELSCVIGYIQVRMCRAGDDLYISVDAAGDTRCVWGLSLHFVITLTFKVVEVCVLSSDIRYQCGWVEVACGALMWWWDGGKVHDHSVFGPLGEWCKSDQVRVNGSYGSLSWWMYE